MMIIEVPKEEREALHTKIGDTEEKEVIVETEGATMEATGLGGEETAGRVSVSEGLL